MGKKLLLTLSRACTIESPHPPAVRLAEGLQRAQHASKAVGGLVRQEQLREDMVLLLMGEGAPTAFVHAPGAGQAALEVREAETGRAHRVDRGGVEALLVPRGWEVAAGEGAAIVVKAGPAVLGDVGAPLRAVDRVLREAPADEGLGRAREEGRSTRPQRSAGGRARSTWPR
jgi:hypothetical protein